MNILDKNTPLGKSIRTALQTLAGLSSVVVGVLGLTEVRELILYLGVADVAVFIAPFIVTATAVSSVVAYLMNYKA